MAKTLKKILELYKPKAGDEQKFVAKHVVAKTDDVNKNGDDVFQGTNVKKVDRKKERHGYEAGEDEKMYEETNLDEGLLDKFKQGLKAGQSKQLSAKAKEHGLSDAEHKRAMDIHQKDGMVASIKYIKSKSRLSEDVDIFEEMLDELSKDTVERYVKAAGTQVGKLVAKAGTTGKATDDEKKTFAKRMKGMNIVAKKYNEEVEHSDLDEGYNEQNGEYRKEAIKHAERVLAAVKSEKLSGCKYIARNLQDMADDMENSIEMAEKYAMKEDVDVSDQSVKLLELYANLNDDNKENMIEMFDTSKDVLLSFINQEESEQDNG